MIKKLLGLEDPLVKKINSKYRDLGNYWKLSNLFGRIFIISLFFLIVSFITSYLTYYLPFAQSLDSLFLIGILSNIIFRTWLIRILIISCCGYNIINIKLAYDMGEKERAVAMLISLICAIKYYVLIVIGFWFKYLKGEELKKM